MDVRNQIPTILVDREEADATLLDYGITGANNSISGKEEVTKWDSFRGSGKMLCFLPKDGSKFLDHCEVNEILRNVKVDATLGGLVKMPQGSEGRTYFGVPQGIERKVGGQQSELGV